MSKYIALTVVGPEAHWLVALWIFSEIMVCAFLGPLKKLPNLESSKDFAKAFMKRHQIPTAEYQTFSNIQEAHAYIDAKGAPIVIKADGLAAGKGVVVAMSLEEAHGAIDMMLSDNKLGDAQTAREW